MYNYYVSDSLIVKMENSCIQPIYLNYIQNEINNNIINLLKRYTSTMP